MLVASIALQHRSLPLARSLTPVFALPLAPFLPRLPPISTASLSVPFVRDSHPPASVVCILHVTRVLARYLAISYTPSSCPSSALLPANPPARLSFAQHPFFQNRMALLSHRISLLTRSLMPNSRLVCAWSLVHGNNNPLSVCSIIVLSSTILHLRSSRNIILEYNILV